jgi:hypothetical protein
VFRAGPASFKRLFAWIVVGAGAFLSLVGGLIATKAVLALTAIAMKVLGISFGAIAAALLPAILAVGVLGVAVAGLKVAIDRNIGGIGDRFRGMGADVALFFRGAAQLIEEGGFSGAVRDELNKVESSGLKRLLIGLYQIAYRIVRIGEGIRTGFIMGLQDAGPVFDDLNAALLALGEQLGELYRAMTGSAAALPSQRYRAFGQVVGQAFAGVVAVVTRAIAIVARLAGGVASGFRQTLGWIGTAFGALKAAFADLSLAWAALAGSTGAASGEAEASTSTWFEVGRVLGVVVGGAITAVTAVLVFLVKIVGVVITVIAAARDFFEAFGEVVGDIAEGIATFFTETIPNAVDALIASLRRMVREVLQPLPDELLPEALVSLKASAIATPPAPVLPGVRGATSPAVAQARALAAAARTSAAPTATPTPTPQPFVVKLEVDGETLAKVAHDGAQKSALRSFTPVPMW